MKTIGLIGGMSWASTIEYYRIMNEELASRTGGRHFAKILLNSVDFGEIVKLQQRNEWDKAGDLLGRAAVSLERAGADFVLIGANTMHKVADQVIASIQVPLLHVADVTAAKILSANIRNVGLLGTKYTMEQDFLKSKFSALGLEVQIPDAEDRETVHEIIYKELSKGIVIPTSRHRMIEVINRLICNGAEGIILGCTELPLLVRPEDSQATLFDTASIHAISAVEKALEA